MKLVRITYQYTEYLRVSTDGGMDSEPNGSQLSIKTEGVMVPSDWTPWVDMAKLYATGNKPEHDPEFKIIHVEVDPIIIRQLEERTK